MDYTDFCYYNKHISSLTKLEIESPYLVIAELHKKRTMEAFHADFQKLQSTLYRDREWMKYNPLDLYTTYEDMNRLLDALYLIDVYAPELSTVIDASTSIKSNNEQVLAIDKAFKKGIFGNKDEDIDGANSPASILSRIYSVHNLLYLKSDLFNLIQIGLDVSYMDSDKYEYCSRSTDDYVLLFRFLEDLITEMYQLDLKEPSLFPSLGSCTDIKFATDSEHPSNLSESDIRKPSSYFFDFYEYNINHEHIYTALTAWKQLLFEQNVWKSEQNPGNLIHLTQLLIELIDAVWLLIQNDELGNINENYTANTSYKNLIKACDHNEFNNPIIAIENFMAYKKSYEWKSLLYKWLKFSLNNEDNYLSENKDQIDTEFNLLIKFTEAVLLLSRSLPTA